MKQAEEHRHLHQQRQTSSDGVNAHLFLDFADFLHLFLLVVLIFAANLSHARLQFTHFPA